MTQEGPKPVPPKGYVPYPDWVHYMALAQQWHCILWWQIYPSGDYMPLLMPVDERTWRQVIS